MARVIFGSSGCIGRSLCKLTEANNINCVALNSAVLDLMSSDASSRISGIVNDGDDVVVLSALTPEKGDPVDTTAANIVMMRNILDGLKSVQVRHFVYISTDSVYSHDIETIKVDSPKIPDRLYGHAHLVREEMLKHAIHVRRWAIIRPCAVYSHNDTHNAYGVMRFIREAISEGSITLFGNGEEHRDHIHADDLASIINHAIESSIVGEFNACSGQSVSFSTLASLIIARLDRPITVKSVARKVSLTHRYIDHSALLNSFSDHLPRPIEAGLDKLFESLPDEF